MGGYLAGMSTRNCPHCHAVNRANDPKCVTCGIRVRPPAEKALIAAAAIALAFVTLSVAWLVALIVVQL